MSDKPPAWTEVLLTLWVVVVGVFYFGGYFVPAIGRLTWLGSLFYAGMVLLSALVLALRYLHRSRHPEATEMADEDTRTET